MDFFSGLFARGRYFSIIHRAIKFSVHSPSFPSRPRDKYFSFSCPYTGSFFLIISWCIDTLSKNLIEAWSGIEGWDGNIRLWFTNWCRWKWGTRARKLECACRHASIIESWDEQSKFSFSPPSLSPSWLQSINLSRNNWAPIEITVDKNKPADKMR